MRDGRHVDIVEGGIEEDGQPDDQHNGEGDEAQAQHQLPYGVHLLIGLAAKAIVHIERQIASRLYEEATAQAKRINAKYDETQHKIHSGDLCSGLRMLSNYYGY